MTGRDTWATDHPELAAFHARQDADQAAWHAHNQLERATAAGQAALENPDLGPEWRDQLRAVCLRAGAVAIGREAC